MANRLSAEQSPYLLQHADNPVEWFPWGPEAFEKAEQENKPIFLSVGYSTCHWCHVMAHESFENEAIAALLNENFVNIKLDREERPDVDHVYMTFIQSTTGQGGWPMSVWLTPDLKPFYGGTYFPPDSRYGRPGFPDVITQIASAWKENGERVTGRANELTEILRQNAQERSGSPLEIEPKRIFETAFTTFKRIFDETWGGFGKAPKFPRPVSFEFLLRYSLKGDTDAAMAAGMVYHSLRMMAAGGMHDHLGGGFHRYSVDEYWHVPHFEKMLYDQGQLACLYTAAFQLTRDTRFERVTRDLLNYVMRDLRDPSGGFYSAEDADSLLSHDSKAHAEGAFYVWSEKEIDAALDVESARLIKTFYGVEENGNAPAQSDPHGEFTGKNIFIERMSPSALARESRLTDADTARRLDDARKKLFEVRSKRPRPHLDDKVLTSWNGLMISGFAKASTALSEPAYLQAAQASALFIQTNLYRKPELLRSWRAGKCADILGFAEDYAFLIQGLLDLFAADADFGWVEWALELQTTLDRDFLDPADGLYFSSNGKDPSVLVRSKSDYDGAEPAANSVIALNLIRFSALLDKKEWREKAGRILEVMAEPMLKSAHSIPLLVSALDAFEHSPAQVVITSPEGEEAAAGMLKAARSLWHPDRTILVVVNAENARLKYFPEGLEMLAHPKQPAAWVCENFRCELPIYKAEELISRLDRPRG